MLSGLGFGKTCCLVLMDSLLAIEDCNLSALHWEPLTKPPSCYFQICLITPSSKSAYVRRSLFPSLPGW